MAKKSKVNKCLTKKKTAKSQDINPFEIHHIKSKHSVLGVKEKRIGGVPGVSRSRALEKRSQTLGVEYKKRFKKNAFVDERFGAGDQSMSLEDKMVARFAAERQKHHSKNRFNLEEEALTHNGHNIDDITEFDDIYNSDDDDTPVPDNTTDLHFGGFLTKKESGGEGGRMSGKDMMDEIVAKSKQQKLERQKLREEAMGETAELDKDWSELHGLLAPRIKAINKTGTRDQYDIAVKELMFESKAKPTNRLKTDEELAKERRELLERLEEERLERMRKGSEEKVEQSADALLARKTKQSPNKVLISYDEKGKMNKNEGFEKALGDLKKRIQDRESEDSEEEEEGNADEDSEEGDEDSEEGDEDIEDDDEDENVKELPTLTLNDIEGDEGNCAFEDIAVDEDSGDEDAEAQELANARTISEDLANDTIPFVLEAPEHLSEFTSLVEGRSDELTITIIKRIVASNYPTLKEENKAKAATFYIVLLKYMVKMYSQGTLSKLVLDAGCKQLFSLTKHISKPIYTHFLDVINSLKQLLSTSQSKSLSSVMSRRYVIYLYLLQRVYPVTDYKHAIMTPLLMLINWSLSACVIRHLADVKVGVFLCNFVLQCGKGRYAPETAYFLNQIMKCLTAKQTRKTQEYVSNFRIRCDALVENAESVKPLSVPDLYKNGTSKSDVLYAVLATIRTAMRQHQDFTGFAGIFHELVESLKLLSSNLEEDKADQTPRPLSAIVSSTLSLYSQYSMKVMPFLRYTNLKPKSIKMYEPSFGDVFVRDRKGKDETRVLKKKLKTEMKGAVREIRKDNKFISRVKHREQAGKDRTRKRKVNEIMGFLSKEQGEANDLKYRKKRGEA